jgi:hypothetical protein
MTAAWTVVEAFILICFNTVLYISKILVFYSGLKIIILSMLNLKKYQLIYICVI